MGEPFCYFKMNSRPSCLNGSQLHISGIVITEGKAKICEGHSKMKNIGKMNIHLYVLIMELDTFSNMTHI